MSERESSTESGTDRLEGMLRRWGTDEAAGRATSEMPAVPTSRRSVVWRWMPAAAAAVLLIAAGALFVASRRMPDEPVSPAASAPDPDELQRLRDRLAEAEERISETADELSGEREKVASLREQLAGRENEVLALRETVERLQASDEDATHELARIRQRAEELAGQLASTADELAGAREQLDEARDQLSERMQRVAALTDQVDRLGTQRQELRQTLAAETQRLREMHDEVMAENRELSRALAGGRSRRLADEAAYRKAYLAVAGGGETGLAGWQQVLRNTRLLQRGAALRHQAGEGEFATLYDELEVVLTKLALLDASDAPTAQSFQSLVASSGVIGKIEEAIAAGPPPARRRWLVEAKLVLEGATRAA